MTRVQPALIPTDFTDALTAQMPNLEKYARSITKDPAKADDLVQDCMIRAMEKFHLYQPGTNLRAWLYRMMYNLFCNQYRKRTRYQHVDAEKVLPMIPDQGNQEDTLMLQRAEIAMNKMDPKYRETLYMVAVEGMSYQDVADQTGVALGTVKSRVSRARTELVELMDEVSFADDPVTACMADDINLMQYMNIAA